jgi:hypothetical protein
MTNMFGICHAHLLRPSYYLGSWPTLYLVHNLEPDHLLQHHMPSFWEALQQYLDTKMVQVLGTAQCSGLPVAFENNPSPQLPPLPLLFFSKHRK